MMAEASLPLARRVLVVEDEPAIRMIVLDTLTDEGHEVRVAGSGAAALTILDDWIPDVILLDLTLPGMDGRAFRAAQRSLPPPISQVPVVLMTGVHNQEKVVDELGALALLRKPFDLDDLVNVVAEVPVNRQRGLPARREDPLGRGSTPPVRESP